jgi:DNA polymerase-1
MKISLIDAMQAPKVCAIDLETTGLSYVSDKALNMGIYGDSFEGYFNFCDYSKSQLSSFFRDFLKSHSVILHNAKFDFHFINKFTSVEDVEFSDTMILSQIIDERKPSHKLDYLAKSNFGDSSCIAKNKVDNIWKEIKSRKKVKLYTEVPENLLGDRAVEDSKNSYKLYKIFRPLLYNTSVYSMEKELLKRLLIIEENGVLIDIDYLKTLRVKLQDSMLALEEKYKDINLNSSDQVGKILFNKMNISPTKFTKGGKPSADESVLKSLNTEFSRDVLEYRNISHMLSTYVEAFLDRKDDNNKLHCNFKQLGARTSRLSCTEPNLQQIPKGEMIRKAFIGNKSLSTFDYSQMEAILYALFRKEKTLLSALDSGNDLYKAMATQVFSKKITDITAEERDTAKDIFLGTIYGMGQKTLESRAKGITIGQIRSAFKSLTKFNKEVCEKVESDGYVETIFGYRRHLFEDEAYKGINAIIQGSAAGILKKSIIAFPSYLLNKFRITVHDENIFEDLEKDEFYEVEKIMTEFSDYLKVKIRTGQTWWDCCKDKEPSYTEEFYKVGM